MDGKMLRVEFECPIEELLWRLFEADIEHLFIDNGIGKAEVKGVLGLIWGFACLAVKNRALHISFLGGVDGDGRVVVDFTADRPFMFAPPPAARIPNTVLLLESAMLYRRENRVSLALRILSENEVGKIENGQKWEAV